MMDYYEGAPRPDRKQNAERLRFARQQLKIWNRKVEDMKTALPRQNDVEKREWLHIQLRMANALTRHWHSQVAFCELYA